MGGITDIPDRPELPQGLAESDARYRRLVDQAPVGVYAIRDGRVSFANQRMAAIFGRTVGEILALPSPLPLVHPDDRERVALGLAELGEGREATLRLGFRGLHASGRELRIEVHGGIVHTESGAELAGVLLDVTEPARAEELAHGIMRMEAIGRLAAGAAHDFNNILAVIRITAQMMQQDVEDAGVDPEDLQQILTAVDRGIGLSDQLLELGRDRHQGAESVAADVIVRDLAPLLRGALRPGVLLEIDLHCDGVRVAIDEAGLERIVRNLVVNAGGTKGDQRRVCLATRRAPRPSDPDGAASWLCVEVSDDGPAIPPDLRDRIFEPFSTTKGERGSGLELANVWAVARTFGGVVTVESGPDRGSTFRVFLPTTG
ncbi:MAG TPA: ATP-binding protein [Longimicrobiales bacterium]|jgi:PAS domain S-box-containing protein